MLMHMHSRRIRGFSLIEVMAVVGILGILAVTALPSYQSSVRKGKRQVAISDLLLYKQAQERYRTTNLTYATSITALTAVVPVNVSSETDEYSFAVDAGATGSYYKLIATPLGAQAKGLELTTCPTLTIDSNDARGPSSTCWAK